MKSALSSSLRAEDEATRDRFAKADSLLGVGERIEEKPKKQKVIRDSFTIPESDYELIASIRQRCLNSATNATKSEVVRAGLQVLMSLNDDELLEAIARLEKVKTGRPGK